jgi:hypothetical protein
VRVIYAAHWRLLSFVLQYVVFRDLSFPFTHVKNSKAVLYYGYINLFWPALTFQTNLNGKSFDEMMHVTLIEAYSDRHWAQRTLRGETTAVQQFDQHD